MYSFQNSNAVLLQVRAVTSGDLIAVELLTVLPECPIRFQILWPPYESSASYFHIFQRCNSERCIWTTRHMLVLSQWPAQQGQTLQVTGSQYLFSNSL